MKIDVPSLLRIKPKAIDKLGKYLKQLGFDEVTLFWGQGVENLFGDCVQKAIVKSNTEILESLTIESAEVRELFDIALSLKSSTKAIVGIGGGTVIDAAKYIASHNKLPLLVFPTVISNDGFCSPTASLIVDGKKKSLKTKLPNAVVIDTKVLQKAPKQFFYSGVGDLLSKYSSIYDWKLAYHNTGEYVDDFAVAISQNSLEAFVNYPNKDSDNLTFLNLFANSLMMSGIAMEVAGCSRPASGSEHLISHAYDQVSSSSSLHGIQVGVATYAVSYIQEKYFDQVKSAIVETGFVDYVKKSEYRLNKQEFIESIKLAPLMKENFFTVLSVDGSIEKLIEFVKHDELIQKMFS